MKIERLRVENFRCFIENDWTFSPNFNILIGANGAGKSSLIEALKIAVGSFFLGIDGITAPGIGSNDAHYRIDIGSDRAYENIFYPIRIEAEGNLAGQRYSWKRERYGKKRNTTYGGASELNKIASQLQKRARSGDRTVLFPLITCYGAGRLFQNLQDRSNRPISPKEVTYAYRGALSAESDSNYQLSWWRSRILASHGNITGTPLLEVIYQSVLAVLGDGWTDIRYDFDYANILVLNPKKEWHPIVSLSDGQRSLLAMALDMSYRCTMLNPSLESKAASLTEGIVLIDELDLHLHPVWQREIVRNLRRTFPKIQFIATTHSPIILQNLDTSKDCVIQLDASSAEVYSISDFADQPIEDVLIEQGYDEPHLSTRRQEMIEVAEEYYRLLKEAKNVSSSELEKLKKQMDELALPYHDNPAYIAFLNMERHAELGERA